MPRQSSGLIDLHTHTTASDGSYTPPELVSAGVEIGLDALAITDHDTFEGFDAAAPLARGAGLNLLRGIELNSRLGLEEDNHRYAHVLGYWPWGEPTEAFMEW